MQQIMRMVTPMISVTFLQSLVPFMLPSCLNHVVSQGDSVDDGVWRCGRKVFSQIKLLAVRRRFCLPFLVLATVLVNVSLMIFWLPHKFEFLVLSDRSLGNTSEAVCKLKSLEVSVSLGAKDVLMQSMGLRA